MFLTPSLCVLAKWSESQQLSHAELQGFPFCLELSVYYMKLVWNCSPKIPQISVNPVFRKLDAHLKAWLNTELGKWQKNKHTDWLQRHLDYIKQ